MQAIQHGLQPTEPTLFLGIRQLIEIIDTVKIFSFIFTVILPAWKHNELIIFNQTANYFPRILGINRATAWNRMKNSVST